MDQVYKIISFNAIFPIIFSFCENDDEEKVTTLNVSVDYFNNKVYFGDNISKYPKLDFIKLEEELLKKLTPPEVNSPIISEEIFERAKLIKSKDYTESFMKNMNGKDI